MPEKSLLPQHLGLILDGNRRWAREQGKPATDGHTQGLETLLNIVLHAIDKGVPYVTVYVFSTENWLRTQDEVSFLMGLVAQGIEKHLHTFHEAGVKVVMLGSRDRVEAKVLTVIDDAVVKTANNKAGTLGLCFNYGGHQEIVDGVKSLINHGVKAEDVTLETFQDVLYAPEIPPLDLIIRTSGEQRLSGFMLYRAAYAELYFTHKYWPAFTTDDLDAALADYADRQRRFGK